MDWKYLYFALAVIICSTKSQETKPLVSVIVPVFNRERELFVNCINDLLEQSYKNLEIIVINDGSTQEHIETILSEFERSHPDIFRVIRLESNMG